VPNILILAIGKMKQGPMADAFAEYQKRMRWKVTVKEFDFKDLNANKLREKESQALMAAIPTGYRVIACDERGKETSSMDFAHKIEHWQDNESNDLVFLIGGANGHADIVRKKADFLLSFGRMTWPHMMARVMLMEQLYRAQQIMSGHPYHRE
jgi:23S rRNA (pseudouridine1915-N3)-methyltransferase